MSVALAIVMPILVATSRMYRGMHNLTDVICGALVGAGCVLVGYVSVRAGTEAARERQVDGSELPSFETQQVA